MTQVIKEGNHFFYSDDWGHLPENNQQGLGLYYRDTRFLSKLEWELDGVGIIPLHAKADGAHSVYRYTNQSVEQEGTVSFWRESLEIERQCWLHDGVLVEQFRFANLDRNPLETHLIVRMDADFADMFIVRGYQDGKVGEKQSVQRTGAGLRFSYHGADDVTRSLEVKAEPAGRSWEDGRLMIPLSLAPGEEQEVKLTYVPAAGEKTMKVVPPEGTFHTVRQAEEEWIRQYPQVDSDSSDFNEMYRRGLADMRMLLTDVGDGPFPVAGLPWYAVPFGRDSLIAAWQSVAVQPEWAKATIRTMARHQGEKVDGWRDEEPGKILHEIRYGELAATGQIPFTPYYGTVDATPLFLLLIGEVYRWTGDEAFVQEYADAAKKAFRWIEEYGDPDGRGYTVYQRKSEKGIGNQGWKDSADSVVHRDHTLAEAPIALVEVQGYVYQAQRIWSSLFRRLGEDDWADRLIQQSDALQERFQRDFWMADESFPALALDKEDRQVGSVTSNPGHCLIGGILGEEQAASVARRLLAPDLFSGWGIRTMSRKARSYNPMSYHNGSVWPHDNSLILLGLKESGFDREAETLMQGLIDTAAQFEGHRLPELFCGYGREEGEPVPYPVACSPQAWAAGTAFVLLQVMTGLNPDPERGRIELRPSLPPDLSWLHVRNLRVGSGHIDLRLVRSHGVVHAQVERNTTGWPVEMG
ncbi:amylo-alpha-1,6-glucosidase [Desmospora profundinema]|uniref:Glycogen debranching enzyme n=1 Tax=Desmospora profundinema TaxID=1571184 RepID=A0ABU1ITR0_9BACL|nr:amylo-alpha-1,6-glucosidase [Desmospora profundinema]MDR6227155.1 glycogen debranching enzyme [Desmospora profundinema]